MSLSPISSPCSYIAGEEMTHYCMQQIMESWVKPHVDTSKWEFFVSATLRHCFKLLSCYPPLSLSLSLSLPRCQTYTLQIGPSPAFCESVADARTATARIRSPLTAHRLFLPWPLLPSGPLLRRP